MPNKISEPKFEVGDAVIYINGDRCEIGIVKKVCERTERDRENNYFVYYSTGDTAARTGESHLREITNGYAYDIRRRTEDAI